jgi:hypothetical protein
MARGLTHPTAHIGKPIIDVSTQTEYVYDGFIFSRDIKTQMLDFEIIKTMNKEQDSGAIFMFSKSGSNTKYGVLYYSRSVTQSSSISASDLGMQYSGRKGATENLGIQSDKLITGGVFENRTLNDQNVRCAVFRRSDLLETSILNALQQNIAVGPHIYDAVNDYFKSQNLSKFQWDGSFRDSDINELGKYLGELLIGVIVLRKRTTTMFSQDIFVGQNIKEFIVPDDPSFSGVDSAFVKNDGSLIPISSKLGAGAKASFFTNFLPKVIYKVGLGDSVIGDIAATARNINIRKTDLEAKRGAKEITYEYGIRKILGIGSNKIKNTYKVFQDAKLNKMTNEVVLVMEEIKKNPKIDNKVKDLLPLSITAAFSREIARRLNNDQKSIDIVTSVLSGKNFYQANLDINKWKRGEVYFKLLLSGEAVVSFIGSKAAINDIDAKQGLVNYELKYS